MFKLPDFQKMPLQKKIFFTLKHQVFFIQKQTMNFPQNHLTYFRKKTIKTCEEIVRLFFFVLSVFFFDFEKTAMVQKLKSTIYSSWEHSVHARCGCTFPSEKNDIIAQICARRAAYVWNFTVDFSHFLIFHADVAWQVTKKKETDTPMKL